MIRQAIVVTTAAAAAVLTIGPNAVAFVPPPTVVCVRAPCPQLPTVVRTTARHVFGPDRYRAHGWACRHVTGRVWLCVQPPARHRWPNA